MNEKNKETGVVSKCLGKIGYMAYMVGNLTAKEQ